MALTPAQISKLKQLIRLANDLLSTDEPTKKGASKPRQATEKRRRRSGKELVAFRRMLKSERKKGTPVAELARLHGISTAYIYSIN